MNQLLAIIVGLPLLTAPIVALIPKRTTAWLLTFITLMIVAGLGVLLAFEVLDRGFIDADLGNWAPPFGIEYRADGLNVAVLVLIAFMALVILPFALPSYLEDIAPEKQPVCYAVFLLCVTGLLGMTITHDLFNIYVFLEVSSLATYTLIALGRNKSAPVAAFSYLILGSIGATFFLIGIGFVYMASGTLNLTDIAAIIRPLGANSIVHAGMAFIVIGLLLKAAVFPVHLWLVRAYAFAPTIFTAFLAATATKVSLYLLMRLIYGVFGWNLLPHHFLLALSAGAIVVGSIAAIRQQDVKQMLAFSTIAQTGYIIFALSLGTSAGLAAAILHLLLHGPAKAGLFLCVAMVERQRGGSTRGHFSGLGKNMPVLTFCFTIFSLSLIGIPLTAGFLSKWLLLSALMQAKQWAGLFLVLLSSLLAVIYMGRVLEAIYYGKEEHVALHRGQAAAPWPLLLSLLVLAAAVIYVGAFSEGILQLVQQATNLYFRAGE